MRRALALSALFGVFVTGLGCKHVAGKCDCTHDPADAVLPTPNNPYFPSAAVQTGPVGPAIDPATVAPAPTPKVNPMPMKPMDSIPPSKSEM